MTKDSRQGPAGASSPQTAGKNQAGTQQEAYWQSFPHMEKALGVERPPVLAQVETTCRTLDTLVRSGSSQEAARAQAAMNAYARMLELYRQLATTRDEALSTSNNRSAPNDK